MSYGSISDAMVGQWLSLLQNSARYASVHYEIPNWLDPGASEAFNPGYARQLIYWGPESARGIMVVQPLVFPAISAMTVAAIGLWSELVSGTMVTYCTAAPGQAAYLSTTGTLTIPANEIGVRL